MPAMEKLVLSFAENTDIHEDFRLWLTSMPSVVLPATLCHPELFDVVKRTPKMFA